MRGLDWQALPTVCEMLGVDDVEPFVMQLIAIRDNEKGS